MSQYSWSQDYTLRSVANLASAKEIKVGEAEFGRVFVPAGVTGVTLTFYGSAYSEEDTENTAAYEPIHNSSGAVSLTIAADESHEIPGEVMRGLRFLKIISNVDDEDVALSFSD